MTVTNHTGIQGMVSKTNKKRGLSKGQTNNPFGRPFGSKNKVPSTVKKLYEEFSVENFEQFKKDYDAIDDNYQRAKLWIDISKMLVPRPVNEDEVENNRVQSEIIKRLFTSDVNNLE